MASLRNRPAAIDTESPPAVPDTSYQMSQLGRVIRDARKVKRLSLEELAARSGVSSGLLSQIERGFGNPSFVTLTKIAVALDIPMTAFYQGPAGDRQAVVTKRDRKVLTLAYEGITYELLTPDFKGPFQLTRSTIPPRFENSSRPMTHDGRETLHVLSGKLKMTVGDQTFDLAEGDSLTFDSSVPHWYVNPLAREVELIIASSQIV
jgi:transcriptional regulator with XRE-family HTH domain